MAIISKNGFESGDLDDYDKWSLPESLSLSQSLTAIMGTGVLEVKFTPSASFERIVAENDVLQHKLDIAIKTLKYLSEWESIKEWKYNEIARDALAEIEKEKK